MVDIEISGLWVNSSIGGWTSSSQLKAFIKQLISAEQKGILWAYRLWTLHLQFSWVSRLLAHPEDFGFDSLRHYVNQFLKICLSLPSPTVLVLFLWRTPIQIPLGILSLLGQGRLYCGRQHVLKPSDFNTAKMFLTLVVCSQKVSSILIRDPQRQSPLWLEGP